MTSGGPTTPPAGASAPGPDTRRLTTALFAGGIATFADLYAVQAVLPALADEFALTESTASLAVSVATGALALSVLPWAFVGDRVGRARAMRWAAVAAALCAVALPFAPTFGVLLAIRAVSGAALGALPALAMAHLVARAAPSRVAAIGGLYIAGTTIGGLTGRVLTGAVAAGWGWRWGVAVTAALVAVAVAVFVVLSRGDEPDRRPRTAAPRVTDVRPPGGPVQPPALGAGARLKAAFTDRTVAVFYAQAFLLMGGFVTIYNLLGFRLLGDPYRLPASVVSLLFLTYLVGTVGSSGVGRAVARFGRRPVLITAGATMAAGVALTLAEPLWLVLLGLVVATFAFFPAHAIAASWAGERIPGARSQVAATYSLAYYAGSSLVGFAGAAVYDRFGWTGAMGVVITGCVIAASIAAVGAPRR